MLSNFRLTFILIGFVLLSKEILVFNEETLILFSFILFSYLSYKFVGDSFYKELHDRNFAIEKDLQFYNNIQKDIILNLFVYYENQKNLVVHIQNIINFIKHIVVLLTNRFLFLLKKQYNLFIENNLKKLVTLEQKLKNDIQESILEFIMKFLVLKFSLTSKKTNNRLHLKNSIKFITKKK